MQRRLWTTREIALVRELYPHAPTSELAARLGRSITTVYQRAQLMGLRKSAEYLASPHACRLRRGDNVGAASRYQKGHVPANKGLRRPGWGPGRMKEHQFKKGQYPSARWDRDAYCIGALRINAAGYVDMKVRHAPGAKAWRPLHRIMWEDVHGPVPRGFALRFKDGDPTNFDSSLANLELISRADLCRRNSIHNLPPQLKGAITMLGALKRRINREEQDRGPAQSPVRDAGSTEGQGRADGP